MSDADDDALVRYVRAAAHLTRMPLSAEREAAVTVTMARIAALAAELAALPLADDVEIAGVFTP